MAFTSLARCCAILAAYWLVAHTHTARCSGIAISPAISRGATAGDSKSLCVRSSLAPRYADNAPSWRGVTSYRLLTFSAWYHPSCRRSMAPACRASCGSALSRLLRQISDRDRMGLSVLPCTRSPAVIEGTAGRSLHRWERKSLRIETGAFMPIACNRSGEPPPTMARSYEYAGARRC